MYNRVNEYLYQNLMLASSTSLLIILTCPSGFNDKNILTSNLVHILINLHCRVDLSDKVVGANETNSTYKHSQITTK